jgi:glyoxylase I family protein
MTEAGATVFAPFERGSDYFAADKGWMLNFRVNDLDAMTAQLDSAGIAVRFTEEMEGVGRFAHTADPEGNPIELWEPAPLPG